MSESDINLLPLQHVEDNLRKIRWRCIFFGFILYFYKFYLCISVVSWRIFIIQFYLGRGNRFTQEDSCMATTSRAHHMFNHEGDCKSHIRTICTVISVASYQTFQNLLQICSIQMWNMVVLGINFFSSATYTLYRKTMIFKLI